MRANGVCRTVAILHSLAAITIYGGYKRITNKKMTVVQCGQRRSGEGEQCRLERHGNNSNNKKATILLQRSKTK